MGINLPLVLYTHTDMEDVWPMFFGQFQIYISNSTKIYVAVNKQTPSLPDNCIPILYDDSIPYTDRWKQILPEIKEEVFMFLHEDMILFDKPKFNYIERYYNLVKDKKVESIKMIYVPSNLIGGSLGFTGDMVSDIDNTLITNEFSQFSIQPTIISKTSFNSILDSVGSLNIWDFEMAVKNNFESYMVKLGGEVKRGLFHCDSIIFPYIATAISKGKWNTSEYKKELSIFFKEYNINPNIRGEV